jgi:hypothetical protein
MTTPQAALKYEQAHIEQMKGKNFAIYNPLNRPEAELPVIFGFNNGGSREWYAAVSLSQDGFQLGSHICSSEYYMPHDLGILEGTRKDRHENDYQKHFPGGYRMEFVGAHEIESHAGLQAALKAAKEKQDAGEETQKCDQAGAVVTFVDDRGEETKVEVSV